MVINIPGEYEDNTQNDLNMLRNAIKDHPTLLPILKMIRVTEDSLKGDFVDMIECYYELYTTYRDGMKQVSENDVNDEDHYKRMFEVLEAIVGDNGG